MVSIQVRIRVLSRIKVTVQMSMVRIFLVESSHHVSKEWSYAVATIKTRYVRSPEGTVEDTRG